MSVYRLLTLLAVLLLGACASHPEPYAPAGKTRVEAQSWHAADRLFFNNPATPEFKGADVANSVALDDQRILWVFGDTLLAEPGVNTCDRFGQFDILVHNSLALQTGTDPTTAGIQHFWAQRNGKPDSFFAVVPEDGSWYWMGGVAVIGDQALVFLMRARPTAGEGKQISACAGLNFAMVGWDARIATITDKTPDQWQWQKVDLPENNHWQTILTGSSSVQVDGDFLYAWSAGQAEFGGNPVYLARWPVRDALRGDLSAPYWHTDKGWQTQSALGDDRPRAIVADGNNEISVGKHVWAQTAQPWGWLQNNNQVINSSLCYRAGTSALEFGDCQVFMQPPELRKYPDSQLLVYAVKLHPALSGQGDNTAIATYVVNSCSLQDIQDKCDLYYPRFIKLRLKTE
jgi:hypothetical protein